MSVTLWIDESQDQTVELGPTLEVYRAMADLQHLAGRDWRKKYGALAGVLTQCERQEDADPDWLAEVREQAADFLKVYAEDLSGRGKDILERLKEART